MYGGMSFPLAVGELEYLVNGTVLSLAATARTDSDRNVVGTALETLESLFKSLKVNRKQLYTSFLRSFLFLRKNSFKFSKIITNGPKTLINSY